MDASAHSDGVVALGRKLVEELDLEPSVDTLGRWMAHYIADLITTAEGATGEEKASTENRCFEAILRLWAHRNEMPRGIRPLRALEPIVRAIESLDPDNDRPRYYRTARAPDDDGEKESAAKPLLSLVDGLDYSARVLIGYFLGEAARVAIDKSKDWVKLAEAAGIDDGPSEIVVRFVARDAAQRDAPDPNDAVREQLEKRIQRLEVFVDLGKVVAAEMKDCLKALPRSGKRKTKPERETSRKSTIPKKAKPKKAKTALRGRNKGTRRQ